MAGTADMGRLPWEGSCACSHNLLLGLPTGGGQRPAEFLSCRALTAVLTRSKSKPLRASKPLSCSKGRGAVVLELGSTDLKNTTFSLV